MKQEDVKKELERSARLTGKDVFIDAYKIITEQEKEIERLKEEKKQAQIDVLKELREKYATSGSVNNNWATIIFVDDIDELIKEVQNDD